MSEVGLVSTCLFSFKGGTMFLLHALRDPGRSHLSFCPLQVPSLLFAEGTESLESLLLLRAIDEQRHTNLHSSKVIISHMAARVKKTRKCIESCGCSGTIKYFGSFS